MPIQQPYIKYHLNREHSWLPPSAEQNWWTHLTREFSAHSDLIWIHRQQAVQALGTILLPYQGREAN